MKYELAKTLRAVSKGDIDYYPKYVAMYKECYEVYKHIHGRDSKARRRAYIDLQNNFADSVIQYVNECLPGLRVNQVYTLWHKVNDEAAGRFDD